jgi:hypothetical protein
MGTVYILLIVSINVHDVAMYDKIHLWVRDARHINRIPIQLALFIIESLDTKCFYLFCIVANTTSCKYHFTFMIIHI